MLRRNNMILLILVNILPFIYFLSAHKPNKESSDDYQTEEKSEESYEEQDWCDISI